MLNAKFPRLPFSLSMSNFLHSFGEGIGLMQNTLSGTEVTLNGDICRCRCRWLI